MRDEQDTMINPGFEELLTKVDSRFTLVSLAAKRARELNSYNQNLGMATGGVVPPQVVSTARKSLSVAFEEINGGMITYNRFDPEERAAEEAARLAAEEAARQDALEAEAQEAEAAEADS